MKIQELRADHLDLNHPTGEINPAQVPANEMIGEDGRRANGFQVRNAEIYEVQNLQFN